MEPAPRPHNAATVLALGIVALILPFVLFWFGGLVALSGPLYAMLAGIVAWSVGSDQLRGMKAGSIDPSGRGAARTGWVLGIVATVLWLSVGLLLVVALSMGGGVGPL